MATGRLLLGPRPRRGSGDRRDVGGIACSRGSDLRRWKPILLCERVYYAPLGGQYAVVPPPQGAVVATPPPSCSTVSMIRHFVDGKKLAATLVTGTAIAACLAFGAERATAFRGGGGLGVSRES